VRLFVKVRVDCVIFCVHITLVSTVTARILGFYHGFTHYTVRYRILLRSLLCWSLDTAVGWRELNNCVLIKLWVAGERRGGVAQLLLLVLLAVLVAIEWVRVCMFNERC